MYAYFYLPVDSCSLVSVFVRCCRRPLMSVEPAYKVNLHFLVQFWIFVDEFMQ